MVHIAGNSLLLSGPPSVVRPLPPGPGRRRWPLIFLYNSSCRFSHASAAWSLGIPYGILRCSVRFPPVFLRKTTPFSGHLPSGRPKTAGKFSPWVSSVHLPVSVRKQCARLAQPCGFTKFPFHHFQQTRLHFISELRGIFQDFRSVPGRPRQIPSYTLYDLLFFHPWSCAACWFCIVPDSNCSDVPSRFLGFGWSSPRRHSAIRQFFSGGAAPFGAGFMAKSFHLKYSSLKLSLSGGHFFLRFTLFLLSCHILLA